MPIGSGLADLASRRFAVPLTAKLPTAVVWVAALLFEVGSPASLLTLALLTREPGWAGAVTLIVTVTVAPALRTGKLQTTGLPAPQLPPALAVADCSLTPAGS